MTENIRPSPFVLSLMSKKEVLSGRYVTHFVKNASQIVRPFQVFSLFSVHPGMQNLSTDPEKTNTAKSKKLN